MTLFDLCCWCGAIVFAYFAGRADERLDARIRREYARLDELEREVHGHVIRPPTT